MATRRTIEPELRAAAPTTGMEAQTAGSSDEGHGAVEEGAALAPGACAAVGECCRRWLRGAARGVNASTVAELLLQLPNHDSQLAPLPQCKLPPHGALAGSLCIVLETLARTGVDEACVRAACLRQAETRLELRRANAAVRNALLTAHGQATFPWQGRGAASAHGNQAT